VTRLRKTSIHR